MNIRQLSCEERRLERKDSGKGDEKVPSLSAFQEDLTKAPSKAPTQRYAERIDVQCQVSLVPANTNVATRI